MRNKRKVNLVPFNNNKFYLDAYKSAFSNRLNILESRRSILFLPPFSTLIIEDVHKRHWYYKLRLDLYLVHVPRGGGSFKIGWKSTGTPLKKWIRLWRRNIIVVASEEFAQVAMAEERMMPWQKIRVVREPLLDNCHVLPRKRGEHIGTILVMLGDRATEADYLSVIEGLKSDYKVLFSIHPQVKIKLKSDIYNWEEIDAVVVDASVSITLFLQEQRIPFLVPIDLATSRPMWTSIDELYDGTIKVSELSEKIKHKEFSTLKMNLSTIKLNQLI